MKSSKIGFVIQSRAVQANRGAEVEFVIYGNGYEWNGDSYSTYGVMVHLPFFEVCLSSLLSLVCY